MKGKNYASMNAVVKKASDSVRNEDNDLQEIVGEKPEREKRLPGKGGQSVLFLQIGLCILVILTALLLRLLGGGLYQNVRAWYWEELQKSVIAETFSERDQTPLEKTVAQGGATLHALGQTILV